MKLPLAPPPLNKLFESLSPEALSAWHAQPQPALPEGRYLHWDELRHRTPPHGITHEQWWLAIKIARQVQAQPLPLKDKNGQPFIYTMPAPVIQALHFIDRDASGQILMDGPVASPQDRMRSHDRS